MSAHNVFNLNRGVDPVLGFNTNWNYGGPRKTGSNVQIQRPRMGPWSTREITNAGYSFTLTFAERPIEQVRYIQRFYHEFKFGFFTLIDHDNGGREHVGRFTSYSDDTQTANLKYTVRVTFEEIPQAPMRNYPSDWAHQSHWQHPVDDLGNFLAATSNAGGSTTIDTEVFNLTGWVAQAVPGSTGPLPHPQELYLPVATATDFAQTQYVGWGFRMSLRQSPDLGQCLLFIDGVQATGFLDLAAGAVIPTFFPVGTVRPTVVITGGGAGTKVPLTLLVPSLPLDVHRVKLVAAGVTNMTALSGVGTALIFPSIEVMH